MVEPDGPETVISCCVCVGVRVIPLGFAPSVAEFVQFAVTLTVTEILMDVPFVEFT